MNWDEERAGKTPGDGYVTFPPPISPSSSNLSPLTWVDAWLHTHSTSPTVDATTTSSATIGDMMNHSADSSGRIYLNVPYIMKDIVKENGIYILYIYI